MHHSTIAMREITNVRANECSICPAHASRASHVPSPPQELVERKSEPAKNRASQLIKMLHQSALVSQMELPDGQLSTLSIDVLKESGPDIVDLCGQLAPLLPWPFGDVASGAPRAKGNWRARQLKILYPGFCALLSQGRTVDLATSEVLPIVSLLETHGGIASVRDRHLIFNQLDYLEVTPPDALGARHRLRLRQQDVGLRRLRPPPGGGGVGRAGLGGPVGRLGQLGRRGVLPAGH